MPAPAIRGVHGDYLLGYFIHQIGLNWINEWEHTIRQQRSRALYDAAIKNDVPFIEQQLAQFAMHHLGSILEYQHGCRDRGIGGGVGNGRQALQQYANLQYNPVHHAPARQVNGGPTR